MQLALREGDELSAECCSMTTFRQMWNRCIGDLLEISAKEAATFLKLNGATQKRIITSLTADEIKYTNPATTAGTSSNVIWRRAK